MTTKSTKSRSREENGKASTKTTSAKTSKTSAKTSKTASDRTKARAYVPLISRHRPKTFDDMVGMQATVKAVQESIVQGEIANAYLLMGSTGCGKTTFARVIARAVMCEKYTGCGKCTSCVNFDSNPDSHMDYTEHNCGDKGKIEDIRGLISLSNTAPMIGNMRVIVLDEAHRLSGASAEAILKPLEEPAEKTLWILATTESQSLKDTLKNRCNIISIRPADRELLAEFLARLASEYIAFPGEDLYEITKQIADMTGGLIRSSLSILDSVIKTYRATGSDMDIQGFIKEVQDEVLRNTDIDTLAAQKIIVSAFGGNPAVILSILADHPNFVGLSRNIVDTSQYLLDAIFNIRGSNVYHPPAFRDTANILEERLKSRGLKRSEIVRAYTDFLELALSSHAELMRFAVPERPLLSSNLLNFTLMLRERHPKKKGSDE